MNKAIHDLTKDSITLLTDRQIQVLKLRNKGLTQEEVAKKLSTSRENITILESRAYRNIDRARETIEALKDLGMAIRISIKPKTHVLDIANIILKNADKANIRIGTDCVELLDRIKIKGRDKISKKRVTKTLSILILPDGKLLVE